MNEASHIHHLLWSVDAKAFWEDDQYRGWSLNAPGGMSVTIGQKGSNWTWTVTRPDCSVRSSPGTFPSVKQAKADLRLELERRRQEIIDGHG